MLRISALTLWFSISGLLLVIISEKTHYFSSRDKQPNFQTTSNQTFSSREIYLYVNLQFYEPYNNQI